MCADGSKVHVVLGTPRVGRVRTRRALAAARICTVMADVSTGFIFLFYFSRVIDYGMDLVNCCTIVPGRGDGTEFIPVRAIFYYCMGL
jgi:hypothetical protein